MSVSPHTLALRCEAADIVDRCCTMVGLVENALEEIKEKMNPDRIIIESRYIISSYLHTPPLSHLTYFVRGADEPV